MTKQRQTHAEILSQLRVVCKKLALGGETLRDILNKDYLHEDNRISSSIAFTWLNPANNSNPVGSSLLAIMEFIKDNESSSATGGHKTL